MAGLKSVGRGSYWQSVFERHADSGLSIRRFCQEHGISQSTFFSPQKKLSKDSSLACSGLTGTGKGRCVGKSPVKQPAEVKTASPATRRDDPQAASPGMSFVAVKFAAESEPIEVVHPLGYVVRVASRANLDCLPRIFQILDQQATK